MKDILLFLKSSSFRNHFIVSILLGCLILWLSFKWLDSYTHHGEGIIVPDFSHIKTEELDRFISDKNLKYHIVDSVYNTKVPAGVVIKQDPEKKSLVKQNRIIYLTVSAKLPPLVKMPNLVDASLRQALALLESYGLKAGKREYRPDPCVNCVLEQSIRGEKIEAGKMIPKGSVINLVLGKGQGSEQISIPCVIGLTHQEALEKIAENGFNKGTITCIDCKTNAAKEKAKVYKQHPACSSDIGIQPGSTIDLYLTTKAVTSRENTTSTYEE